MTILPPSNPSSTTTDTEDNGSSSSLTSSRSISHSRMSILSDSSIQSSRQSTVSSTSCTTTNSTSSKRSSRCPNCSKRRLKLSVSSESSSSTHKSRARERFNKRKGRDNRELVSSKNKRSSSITYKFEEGEGCNSEDEYRLRDPEISDEEWDRKDNIFEDVMKRKGFVIKNVREDGACLFRAISDQLYGTEDMHSVVRRNCMDYINDHSEFFSAFISEDINHYVTRKRNNYVHGNQLEIEAISEKYNRTIEVYSYSEKPMCVFTSRVKDGSPIRLSYQRNCHYNSIVRPCKAQPGHSSSDSAQCSRLSDSTPATELSVLEQTMIEDKIAATDWEATYETMFEQATRESLASYVNDRRRRDPLAGCSTSSATSSSCLRTNNNGHRLITNRVPTPPSPSASRTSHIMRVPTPPSTRMNNAPQSSRVPTTSGNQDPTGVYDAIRTGLTCSFRNSTHSQADKHVNNIYNYRFKEDVENVNDLPSEFIGGWDEDFLLARALAESQEEYLNSLKLTSHNKSEDQ